MQVTKTRQSPNEIVNATERLAAAESALLAARETAIRAACRLRDLRFCHELGIIGDDDFELGAAAEMAEKAVAALQQAREAAKGSKTEEAR